MLSNLSAPFYVGSSVKVLANTHQRRRERRVRARGTGDGCWEKEGRSFRMLIVGVPTAAPKTDLLEVWLFIYLSFRQALSFLPHSRSVCPLMFLASLLFLCHSFFILFLSLVIVKGDIARHDIEKLFALINPLLLRTRAEIPN